MKFWELCIVLSDSCAWLRLESRLVYWNRDFHYVVKTTTKTKQKTSSWLTPPLNQFLAVRSQVRSPPCQATAAFNCTLLSMRLDVSGKCPGAAGHRWTSPISFSGKRATTALAKMPQTTLPPLAPRAGMYVWVFYSPSGVLRWACTDRFSDSSV